MSEPSKGTIDSSPRPGGPADPRDPQKRSTARRWVATRTLSAMLARGAAAYRATPAAARRAWRLRLTVGALLVILGTALMTEGARTLAAAGLFSGEEGVLVWLAERGPISFRAAEWLQSLGNTVWLWVLVLLLGGIAAWRGRALLALTMPAALLTVNVGTAVGWRLWDRPRPDILGAMGTRHDLDAFPSGHVAQALATYGVLAWIWAQASESGLERALAAAVAVVVVVMVAVGRMRTSQHWPSDVVGGLVVGAGAIIVCAWAMRSAGGSAAGRG